ncbi:MAG: UvrD-helicase domain-containing protein [Bacteroidales bacterium]|nr:UvrD-helicase domain-containing protein [Bacteroidales bacterium]
MAKDILSELNESQRLAVCEIDGPVMVIAGAGSGKTRVLTYRIAYMLERGIAPWNILSLTFTNKAAREMTDRVLKLIGDKRAKAVQMGTFHSVFLRVLRTEAEKIGFTHALTVYDTDDSKALLRNIVKEMNLDPKIYVVNFILNRISAAKSSLMSAEDYAQNSEARAYDKECGKPLISDIFTRYNSRLHSANAMDFDDILYYMNALLRDYPETLFKYQNRFQYILVDEYQDTNFAQYRIIKRLADAHHNICVVGDDAQSIYGFRGADINNILNFKRDYKEAKIVKLEQNYRSTQNIVNAANAVIKNNNKQIPKTVWTENEEGTPITVLSSASESDEAMLVCDSIFEIEHNYHVDLNDIAILYRTNMQSRALEECLIKKHIPYRIYGGTSFYARKEIKDILAYCRLAVNHYDEEALRRVINYPLRGIGETSVERAIACANEQGVRMWDVIENPHFYEIPVNNPTREKFVDFTAKIKSFTAMLQSKDAYELGKHIAFASGIVAALKADPSEKDRADNVEELLDAMKDFSENAEESTFNEETGEVIEHFEPTLDRFLENVALLTDADEKEKDDQSKVRLMTIHAAKGLEFDYVYITGLEENLFPSSLSIGSKRELEEERRLFYVAITRAKKVLTLTHAQTRYRYGSMQFCEPSRFLDELPMACLKTIAKASAGRGTFARREPKSNPWGERTFQKKSAPTKPQNDLDISAIGRLANNNDLRPGQRIYHLKFGYGTVSRIDGSNPNDLKAIVAFDTLGEKVLLLKFAKLIIPKN